MEMKIVALVLIILMIVISVFRPTEKQKSNRESPKLPEKPKAVKEEPLKKKTKPVDRSAYHSALLSLLSEHIQSVYYVLVNDPYPKITFPRYDTPDQAVLIQFSNGKWLNWVWEEEGIYGQPEFQLSFSDKREELLDSFSHLVEVSDKKQWKPFLGKALQSFHFEYEKVSVEKSFLAELHLSVGAGKIVLRAVEEPDFDEKEDPAMLSFANDWIMVQFDLS